MKHRNARDTGRHRNGSAGGAHRATDERGRHRAAEHPLRHGRHRAPADITERGRMAVAAAIVAGVGVTGTAFGHDPVSTNATTAALESFDRTASTTRSARTLSETTIAQLTGATADSTPTRAIDAAQRKSAPKPVVRKSAPRKIAAQRAVQVSTPSWVHPMPQGRVTSCFGQRWGTLHAGVDLAAASGTPIRAAGAGKVLAAGNNYGGYGISVLIAHDNGFLTHYAHMSSHSVRVGERVSAGEVIGREGSTGNSTGPHLHFEVHKGNFQNPVEPTGWLRSRGVNVGC